MPFGVSEGIGLLGAGANLLSGRSSSNASKEALRRQAQLIQQQNKVYQSVQPTYQSLLAQGAQSAGIGHTGVPGAMLPEDQARFAAANDQISHLAQQRQNQLQHTLAQRGIASGSQAAALAHNQRAALQDLAGFRRQLAINQPAEMERRRAALAGLLNPAFGQGAAASAGYGNQAAQYGNEANQAWASLGNIAQNWQQQQSLQHFSKLYGTDLSGGGGYDYSYLDNPVTYGTSPGYGPNVYQGPQRPYVGPYSDY